MDERLRFVGSVVPDEKSSAHFQDVILPLVDSVLAQLRVSKCSYQITIDNLSAASVTEQDIQISGHSMDVALFLALLAAPLGLSVPTSALFTGHIGGASGQILMVRSLSEKIQCAIDSPDVTRFHIPELDADGSLKRLRPQLREELHCIIAKAKRDMRITHARNITELIQDVFGEHSILLASLQNGLFNQSLKVDTQSARYLCSDLPARFLKHLRELFMQLDEDNAHKLCQAWVKHHFESKQYPTGAGSQLSMMVTGLPPQVKKRLRQKFPLSKENRLTLGKFANATDATDVQSLFNLEQLLIPTSSEIVDDKENKLVTSRVLDDLLKAISPHQLAKSIASPLFEARATYFLTTSKVRDSSDFFEVITSFHVHLLQHMNSIQPPSKPSLYRPQAINLVEQAYAKGGGVKAALRESLEPLQGGVASVLDSMTHFLIEEQKGYQVRDCLATAIAPLDWQSEINLMDALISKIKPDLPDDLQSLTAEELAGDWQHYLIQYSNSQNQFHQIIRNI